MFFHIDFQRLCFIILAISVLDEGCKTLFQLIQKVPILSHKQIFVYINEYLEIIEYCSNFQSSLLTGKTQISVTERNGLKFELCYKCSKSVSMRSKSRKTWKITKKFHAWKNHGI